MAAEVGRGLGFKRLRVEKRFRAHEFCTSHLARTRPQCRALGFSILRGSWDLVSRVISKVTIVFIKLKHQIWYL